MNEHRIRLRGGWEWRPESLSPCAPTRLTLPVRWGSSTPRRIVLSRGFGRPPVEHGTLVLLQMDQVEGIVSLSLNGRSIFPVLPEITHYEIKLPTLAGRNILLLEVEVRDPEGAIRGAAGEWGVISLVVRTDD